MRTPALLALITAAGLMAGCATVGNDFPDDFASHLTIGKTTRAQVEQTLGKPFRTGLDSGSPSATYMYYHLGLFVDPVTKDLTVTYAPDGTVKSYTFNSNLAPGSGNSGATAER
jgi:hypothetical protein